jgi:hypothetical protein
MIDGTFGDLNRHLIPFPRLQLLSVNFSPEDANSKNLNVKLDEKHTIRAAVGLNQNVNIPATAIAG